MQPANKDRDECATWAAGGRVLMVMVASGTDGDDDRSDDDDGIEFGRKGQGSESGRVGEETNNSGQF